MTEELERSFQLVGRAEDRPRKRRSTVRVILVNESEQTLLFEDSDPGLPQFRWWVVPGGGVDPGESEEETAVREIAEETGLVLSPAELVGPLARRYIVHGYSDQVIEQDETFYLAHVSTFEVSVAGFTEEEKLTMQQHRWWPRSELASTTEWIWPDRLPELWDLADTPGSWPLEMGAEEESTWADDATGSPPSQAFLDDAQ